MIQRMHMLWMAAKEGDIERLLLILEAGCDVDGSTEYGVTALHFCAWHCRSDCLELLIQWGADVNKLANGGLTSVFTAARAGGHLGIIKTLGASLPPLDEVTQGDFIMPLEYDPPLALDTAPTVVRLIDETIDHPGAGAFYIDGGLTEHEVQVFISVWERLPREPYSDIYRLYRGDVERSYYWDCTGWVRKVLARAVERAQRGAGVDGTVLGAGEALPYLRMLHYSSQGSNVGPHCDVPKKETVAGLGSTRKRSSRLTFLLYLTGDEEDGAGGETLMLEREDPDSHVLARVKPRRGRMLVFPHSCPHASSAIEQPPKILIRGEFL